jgi:CheY-like chemotaxis protein
MTAEMAFECLFVSRDPGVFRVVSRILRDLSITTNICLSSSKAAELLDRGSTDLVVIDWEGDDSSALLKKIWKLGKCKKPTVLAVSATDCAMPGVHVVLRKPVTMEAGKKCLRTAYSRMLVDHRRHARYPVMMSVIATADSGRTLRVTVTDIGDGGVGISTKETLTVGDILSFRLHLTGTPREILAQVRVLWSRDYGRYGCEFMRIPPVDLIILHDWLKSKQRIKKPLNPL